VWVRHQVARLLKSFGCMSFPCAGGSFPVGLHHTHPQFLERAVVLAAVAVV
jgi:hypothetical protein